MTPWIPYALSLMGLLFSLYSFFHRETKEESREQRAARKAREKEINDCFDEMEERMRKAEGSLQTQDLRIQGIVLQNERERDNTQRRFDEIMSELSKLPALYTTVATVATDVKHLTNGISDIKATLHNLKN